MVDEKWFKNEHIQDLRTQYGGDPALHEKCIHAFALLAYLVEAGLPFIFKGGTSLLLHLQRLRRLSIDIDVLSHAPSEELVEAVEWVASQWPFVRWEEDDRGARGLPKRRHFKFFYESLISDREDYVILDVVEEDGCDLLTEQKSISTAFLDFGETGELVTVLTVEALLGDKLTAFAPNTLGVPYATAHGHSMTMQVVKQLFDVGELFNAARDYDVVKKSFDSSYALEKTYRNQPFSREDVLRDIIETGLGICGHNLRGAPSFTHSDLIVDGVRRLQSHLIRDPFTIAREAKIAASKAVLLASALLNGHSIKFEEYTETEEQIEMLRTVTLAPSISKYARLKVILPEAFFHLSKVVL